MRAGTFFWRVELAAAIFSSPSSRHQSASVHRCWGSTMNVVVLLSRIRRNAILSRSPVVRFVSSRPLKVREIRVQDAAKHKHRVATVYESNDTMATSWTTIKKEELQDENDYFYENDMVASLQDNVITYFLPARYPESVAPGYARYAGFCFCASIGGSAAMVLSTQTLLLAVGTCMNLGTRKLGATLSCCN